MRLQKLYDMYGKKKIDKMVRQRAADSKARSKKKKYKHETTTSVIRHMLMLTGGICPATGAEFVCKKRHPQNFSIDRIDSNKGYTIDNTWLVCNWYNKAKMQMSVNELSNLIQQMSKLLGEV